MAVAPASLHLWMSHPSIDFHLTEHCCREVLSGTHSVAGSSGMRTEARLAVVGPSGRANRMTSSMNGCLKQAKLAIHSTDRRWTRRRTAVLRKHRTLLVQWENRTGKSQSQLRSPMRSRAIHSSGDRRTAGCLCTGLADRKWKSQRPGTLGRIRSQRVNRQSSLVESS